MHDFTALMGLWLWLACPPSPGGVPPAHAGPPALSQATDQEVVLALQSPVAALASAAADELVRRGERVIPRLLGSRGNRRPFAGRPPGRHPSLRSVTTPAGGRPTPGTKALNLSMEVVSYYLVSAIYYGRADFAEGPLLIDRSKPADERKPLNHDRRVWQEVRRAYQEWGEALAAADWTRPRRPPGPPLAGTRWAWWGEPNAAGPSSANKDPDP